MSTLFNLLLAFVLSILGSQVAQSTQSTAKINKIDCAEQLDFSQEVNIYILNDTTTRIIKN